jgi:hypothetical protein
VKKYGFGVTEMAKCLYNGRILGLVAAFINAKVAELVDALDLGSSRVTCESSSLSFRTIYSHDLRWSVIKVPVVKQFINVNI